MMASESSATYVYCVVRASRRPSARIPQGLPGATRPELTEVTAGLFLVTSEVPLDVYSPAQLEPRLRDLEWVADVALAHESVVERFARQRAVTVIPMKMFTMFSSIDKAVADVRDRRRAIEQAVRRIAGCEEWGIRITRVAASVPPSRNRGDGWSGAAFLAARKKARDDERIARGTSRAAADTAFTRLRRLARAVRRRSDHSEPGSNPPILEASFLVTAGGRARFKAEARRLAASCAAAGAAMVLTGPWPAYNFVNAAEDRA